MDLEQEYIYSNSPINRIISKTTAKNKFLELDRLKKKIESIENCELKKNANRIVFSDGDVDSPNYDNW